jgi:hypothetical protein
MSNADTGPNPGANSNLNANGANAVPFVPTRQITTTTTLEGPPASETLYPPEGPDPAGTRPEAVEEMERGAAAPAATGTGIEGEEVVWEGRYSMKNFIGRIALRAFLTVAWVALLVYVWDEGYNNLDVVTWGLGAVLLVMWLMLGFRILQARLGHHYKLTNRRLFVSTGLARRRRDQVELLRVKDVYTRHNLVQGWLSVGSVVVVSDENVLPTLYLTGVDDPQQLMDLIWHHARAERDNRATKVDAV